MRSRMVLKARAARRTSMGPFSGSGCGVWSRLKRSAATARSRSGRVAQRSRSKATTTMPTPKQIVTAITLLSGAISGRFGEVQGVIDGL